MASFEVEYSYIEPVYEVLVINADSIEDVEEKALALLAETLPEGVEEMNIENIKEIKTND